jgi:M6 family metalloprotease-like protein
VLLAVVTITVTNVRGAAAVKEMASGPVVTGHSSSRMVPHSLFDVRKLSGDYKLIVILVEFADVKHEISRDTIHDMVFKEMNEYWREMSYGQFNVIGDTVGWINVGPSEAYYGKDTNPRDPGSDQRGQQLVADACRLATGVNFSNYQDIMVVYAGHGQESRPEDTDLLWSFGYWSGLDVACGDRKFGSGGVASEITETGVFDLGAFSHEFGHSIGLPDLYHVARSSQSDDYVGSWSLMASGAWGGPGDDGSNPTGLESWSRIKLGWLSSVSVSMTSDDSIQLLNPIGDTSGPRALKIATKGLIYYLVEVRETVGVDEYLPDSGVLITRVDEARGSGEGIVRVMDCHPETRSIDDATCKINDSWEDRQNNIYVKVIGEQGGSFTIAVASKPVTVIQVSVVTEPVVTGVTVTIDGVAYDSSQLPLNLVWTVGSTHDLGVQPVTGVGYGVRYVFVQWSDGSESASKNVKVTQSATYVAKLKVEYLLTVNSPYGNPEGAGWREKGSLATFSVASPSHAEGLLGVLGGKYVFDHWSGDSTVTTSSASVVMDGPRAVTAEWRTDNTMAYLVMGAVAVTLVVTGVLMFTRRVWKTRSSSAALQGPIGAERSVEVIPPSLQGLSEAKQRGVLGRWCISCGRQIMRDSMFCEYCGARQPDS